MSQFPDLAELQGNILHGYRRAVVRHLVLEVVDRAAAQRFLAASIAGDSSDVPAITRGTILEKLPDVCFNLGLTYEGLRALGTPATHLASFPTEFVEGMTRRAAKLGDFGASAPESWPSPFDRPERVHVVATLYADKTASLDRATEQVENFAAGSHSAFAVAGVRDGRNLDGNKVIFGYRDSISQPSIRNDDIPDRVRDPLGTVLLGYPTRSEGIVFRVPTPPVLGRNGTFSVFRVLAQDAFGFEDYLDRAADELIADHDVDRLLAPGAEKRIGSDLTQHGALREIVAAQMCGRWRDGTPYAVSPDWPLSGSTELGMEESDGTPPGSRDLRNDFDYGPTSRCPVGSHMRRVNPRGGLIVQRIANHTRRLVRRGMTYGPDFDPAIRDDEERGLLGHFIGANLGAQFEAVMCDWLNLGLHHPDITGSNDPLIGANQPETSWFDLTARDGGAIRLRGFPRFVTTRGGSYTFLPSLPALSYLSKLP